MKYKFKSPNETKKQNQRKRFGNLIRRLNLQMTVFGWIPENYKDGHVLGVLCEYDPKEG